MGRLFFALLICGFLAVAVARADTPAPVRWCLPGERLMLEGVGPPDSALLVRWDERAVGGGVSSVDGRFQLALIVGPEQPGEHRVSVTLRTGREELLRVRCMVPRPEQLRPTPPGTTATPLPPPDMTSVPTPTAPVAATATRTAPAQGSPTTLAPTSVPPGTVIDGEVTPAWWPCKEGQIKGNVNSGIYHVPGSRHYARTYANVVCFDTAVQARDAGYRPPEN